MSARLASSALLRVVALALSLPVAPAAFASESVCSAQDGRWVVTREDEPLEIRTLNSEARRANAPVFAVGASFTMRRPAGDVPTDREKQYNLKDWDFHIYEIFDRHGFYEGTGADKFKAKLEEVYAQLPYNRQQYLRRARGPVEFVVNDIDLECLGDEDGLMGAYSLMSFPQPGVGSDWGAVTVGVVGLGSCGPGSHEARALADKVLRDLTKYICRNLEELPE